ncbi:heparan-alpha-glucosaminide N-acetyltransferase [Methanococcoides burtonii]|uniref:Heparan-alpha-glucosaminide N-acetyltransferase catalytic domain-containing protein n=1 Tax=Methanococcoides burtonii (strain DSM 6242 / NBRC 107633 / OCM 468 / ACE-M) TaxID=259564 RepID=Q12ZG6_METBU|nr:heparan-alpha-glucosaminide N-acetyltransferase [Methanococcoides burtonii]ABE51160.1 Protein of unknown function DUF1624 [Methanococcoides burtonii DSM 6242]
MTKTYERKWEIDLLRGIAITLMVFFHLLYDLYYFGYYDNDIRTGEVFLIGRAAAFLFIFVAGISLTLSFSKQLEMEQTKPKFIKYVKRGSKIFLWGMAITAGSYIFLREGIIIFGALHFIGVAIILSYPFLKQRSASLVAAFLTIIAGIPLRTITIEQPWLLWIGIQPTGFRSYDYFPLIPWFGVMLMGIFTGNVLYPQYKRKFILSDISELTHIKVLTYMGKRSLRIYLLHQPILIAIFYITGFADLSQFIP